jgi:hypothetical protein
LHYKKFLFLILCLSFFFGFGTSTAAEEELLVMTEEFPPFNFQEDKTIKGLSTQIVKELFNRANLKYRIELVPWKRAYNTTLNRPNTLIYTMAKTDSRKNKFHWVGKISNRKLSLFRLRSRQDLAGMTMEEAKKKAKIATIQGDASTEEIMELGFNVKNITRKSQYHFYRSVPLYTKVERNKYVLYKPPGITLGEMRLNEGLHPEMLYISKGDKISGIQEAQKAFNSKLESDIQSGSPEKIKETLAVIMEEKLT